VSPQVGHSVVFSSNHAPTLYTHAGVTIGFDVAPWRNWGSATVYVNFVQGYSGPESRLGLSSSLGSNVIIGGQYGLDSNGNISSQGYSLSTRIGGGIDYGYKW